MIIVIIIIVGGSIGIILTIPSAPLLSGSKNVSPGEFLRIHGGNFTPGGTVRLTLDDRVPVSSSSGTIKVSSGGTFDTTLRVSENWSLSSHKLRATEDSGSRSATMIFTITASPPKLDLRPASLDLGKLAVGSKVSFSFLVSNLGGQSLKWTTDTGGTNWMSVAGGAGVIHSGKFQQVTVLVDTSSLKVGDFSAPLKIHSNGGEKAVDIKLSTVQMEKKQAKLDISPGTLDFGKLATGQQATLNITVANTGTAELDWQAATQNTSWLTLDTGAGKIQRGGQPQTIQVTADTRGLADGPYPATVLITSNAGNAEVNITIVVSGPPPEPVLVVSPHGFNAPDDSDCSYNADQGWACIVSLSSYKSAQADLNWSAASNGVNGVIVRPSRGTLSPGQPARVTVSIPNTTCPAQADITFSGGADPVDILWNCAPGTWSFSPQNFNANTDCPYTPNQGWTCTGTLTEDSGAEGNLHWSASGGIDGIRFRPSSGTLSPGQPLPVTISVPNVTCPTSATFTFSVPGTNSIQAPWSCSPSGPLTVSKATLNGNTDCTYSSGDGWTCTETLALSSNKPGDPSLNWSATSSGINGIKFNPANGTLSVSNPTAKVTITIPTTPCEAQASFVFSDGTKSITVTWDCKPATLVVSNKSFNGNTDCSYGPASEGSIWTCTETLSLANPGDPDLPWATTGSVGGSGQIQYNPPNGTLSQNQNNIKVTITIPEMVCPTKTTLSFLPSGGNSVDVPWSCGTPSWSLGTGSFVASSCPKNDSGDWVCSETVTEDSSAQGDLNWTASSDVDATFSPNGSTLTPGKLATVSITVPSSDCKNGTFTFTQGGDTKTASWSCSRPVLHVNTGGNCPPDGSGNYICTDTLSIDSGAQTDLNWSTSTTLSGVTFSPASGTLTPGSPQQQVTVTISEGNCPSGQYYYSGKGSNTVTVSWQCVSATPTPTPTPTPSYQTSVSSYSREGDRRYPEFTAISVAG